MCFSENYALSYYLKFLEISPIIQEISKEVLIHDIADKSESLQNFVDPNARISMQSVSKDLFKKGGRRKSDVSGITDNKMHIPLEHSDSMKNNYSDYDKKDNGETDFRGDMSVSKNDENCTRVYQSVDNIHDDCTREIVHVRRKLPHTNSSTEIVNKNCKNNPRPPSIESVKVIRNHAPKVPSASAPSSSSSSPFSSRQRGLTANRAGDRVRDSGGGNDVRAQDGQMYLRMKGPPSCFPVWFVGKSD